MIATKEYIKRFSKEYKLLKSTYCKELNERVIFTSEGFNHLIFTHGHKRPLKEIYFRLSLIKYISEIIKNGNHLERIKIKREYFYKKETITKYFAICKTINDKNSMKLKVILRKRGNDGEWIFLSIMGKESEENLV